jgi:hypothetical protein
VVVDGREVRLWPWSTWRDAVTARDLIAAAALRRGEAWLEDARGNAVDPDGAVVDGAAIIVRSLSVR